MGPGGVRIKEKGGAWYVIEGVRNDVVVDAAREAMKMASRSVGFLGSKGMFQR